MKKFESTNTLMELLASGDYKRLVMENDEDDMAPEKLEETLEAILETYKSRTLQPDNYEYFSRRLVKQADGNNSR